MNTSKRCRLELSPTRWLLPQLVALGGLALMALLLSRLPAWLAIPCAVVAAMATALSARRLHALRAIEVIEPDRLHHRAAGSAEDGIDSLLGWQRLGPWVVVRAEAFGRLPLWLPGFTPAARQSLLRTLARCRVAARS